MKYIGNHRLDFPRTPEPAYGYGWAVLPIHLGHVAALFWMLFAFQIRADQPSFAGIPANRTVSVLAFGANGRDDVDDTAAIQKAIDTVAAQGGGTVTFPEGIYLVNSMLGNGFSGAVWMKSHVRLLGVGGRQSILKMPAGSRTDLADRRGRQNRSCLMIGDRSYVVSESATSLVLDQTKWQEDVEIAYLGFDLDNGGGRRAMQMRFATRNVRIHHCEGFQSGIEVGQTAEEGLSIDNHFFNMASYGAPVDQGVQTKSVDISQNVTIDNNIVRDFLQLTADGGSGIRNLWIHHNKVYDPQEFGIAITFTGSINTIMEDLLIEDNEIFSPGGAGIVVWPNFVGGEMDLSKVQIQALRRVTIRRNKILVKPVTYAGQLTPSGRNSSGIGLGSFLTETRDISIVDNELTAENPQNLSNSRQAFRMVSWDLNWTQKWQNHHHGAAPTIVARGFDPRTNIITLIDHGLFTGVQVQLTAVGSTDLPSGIESFHPYRLIRIDPDHLSLAQLSGELVKFAAAPSNGNYLLTVSPVVENMDLARNKIEGDWDWAAYFSLQTKNLRVSENSFCTRFVFSGSHDNLSFFTNRCSGSLSFVSCTLRDGRFYGNSWSVVDSVDHPYYGSSICSFNSATDPSRRIEATFESNRFSFTSLRTSRAISALSMTTEGWSGSGALRIRSNQFITPTTLNWSIAPAFLTEMSETPPPPQPLTTITNPGFELISVGSAHYNAFAYAPSIPGWSFTGAAGISGNRSGFTATNPDAPEGSQVAFLQKSGSVQQTILFAPGTYALSALVAQRACWQQQLQTILVYVDSEEVGSFFPKDSTYTLATTKAFTVTQGNHTIRFTGQATLDGTAFLDKLSLQTTLPITNRGFELPHLDAEGWTSYRYRPLSTTEVQPWTFQGSAGITSNNTGFTEQNPHAPEGSQVAFLQNDNAAISSIVILPGARSYMLSFAAAKRANYNLAEQTIKVFLDDVLIGAITPHSRDYQLFSLPFTSTAGAHRLKFAGTTRADSTAFFDQVLVY